MVSSVLQNEVVEKKFLKVEGVNTGAGLVVVDDARRFRN